MNKKSLYKRLASCLLQLCGITIVGFIASCGSEETVPEGFIVSTNQFKVISDTLRIDGQATEATLTVTADCEWSLQTSGWDDLHATPDHGEGTGNVTITTSKNDQPTERRGVLTITTGNGIKKTMTLVQGPDSVRLEMTPKTLSFGINGGQTEVTINCNTSWTLTGGSDWCTASVNNGEKGITAISIKTGLNNAKEKRTATFTVTPSGGTPQTIDVSQTNKDISFSCSIESINFNATAGQEKQFTVTGNDVWTATVSQDWLEVTPSGGRSSTEPENSVVTVKCLEDNNTGADRYATITVNCGGIEKKISVTQGTTNIFFNVALGEMNSDGSGGKFSVTGNTTWTVESNAEWCHLSGDGCNGIRHQGSGKVELKLDPNPTTEERTAQITFNPTGFDKVVISVVQKEKSIEIILSVSPQEMYFSPARGEQSLNIDCNAGWEITHKPDWVTLSATNGNTGRTLIVSCDANTTSDKRNGSITVSAGNKSAVVKVEQEKAELPEIYDFNVTYTAGQEATARARYRSMLPVTEYGFVYATHSAPTLGNGTAVTFSGSSTEGDINATLNGLTAATTYYVRAYATSAVGTKYSEEKYIGVKRQPEEDDNGKPDIVN